MGQQERIARLFAGWGLLALAAAACGRAASAGVDALDSGLGISSDGGGAGAEAAPVSPGEDAAGGLHLTDAGVSDVAAGDGSGACSFGSAASIATAANLNLFGQIVYYEDGGAFPPGRYRATYTDGCMKYDSLYGWAVQSAGPDASDGFWLVRSSSSDLIAKPPGIADVNGFSTFDECVDANLSTDTPLEFDFDGGPLGVWLDDNPYIDNVAGENGRNPSWSLVLLGKCPPALGEPIPP